jgi:hypothetical protein
MDELKPTSPQPNCSFMGPHKTAFSILCCHISVQATIACRGTSVTSWGYCFTLSLLHLESDPTWLCEATSQLGALKALLGACACCGPLVHVASSGRNTWTQQTCALGLGQRVWVGAAAWTRGGRQRNGDQIRLGPSTAAGPPCGACGASLLPYCLVSREIRVRVCSLREK